MDLTNLPKAFAASLETTGYAVCPDFFPTAELRAHMRTMQSAGAFHRAGIGKGAEVRDQVRLDDVYWLKERESQPTLWDALDRLRESLNRELFLGLRDFEGHYAAYPAGGFYQRHRDVFRSDDRRTVSLVLYLNEDWTQGDGGRLRLYHSDGTSSDIDPICGKLVLFMSREIEHEVLPSGRERLSFTGWFRR